MVADSIEQPDVPSRLCTWVHGPIIIGSRPSGLTVAAGLREQGVPFVILEHANSITYERLRLHLPKQFCQLLGLPFPVHFPQYPSKRQFIEYLDSYAAHFTIRPHFNQWVRSARYDVASGPWSVCTVGGGAEMEHIERWLVVATDENAKVVLELEGLDTFSGNVKHYDYKSGEPFQGQRMLVVGCGNSGMEISLDLCDHNASHPW